jgi:hypothetical protein
MHNDHVGLAAWLTKRSNIEIALAKLYDFCAERQRVIDTFSTLFDNPVGRHSLVIATGESLAHLNYLIAEGRLCVSHHDDGINRHVQCAKV